MRSPGYDRIPHLLSIHPHIHTNLICQLVFGKINRILNVHKHLAVCGITGTLTVEIVSDKCSSSIAQDSQRSRIPVILKSLSGQKDRRYDPLVKHAFNKPAESHIRIFCLVRIEHRIHGCQFFYMRTCHFVHCHKNRLSASKPRLQPSEHIRFDLISVTAKQRRLILPEFFWLIKQIIAETLFVILNENMPFINIHPYCDSPQHLRQLFRQLRNTEHDPVDLRKRLQRQFDKFSKQPYCFIGFFSKFNFFPCQAFIQ